MADYKTYDDIFNEASKKYGVDKTLLLAIAKTESNFNAKATSSVGAKGIMQLMDATAKELGVTNSYDAYQNIMGGAKYISQLLKRYDGDTTKALASYNGGMGNVDKYGASKYSNYYNKVYSNMKLLSSDDDVYKDIEDRLKQRADDVIEDADEKLEEHFDMYNFGIDKVVNVIFTILIAIMGIVFIALSIGSASGQTSKVSNVLKSVKKIKKGKVKEVASDVINEVTEK